MRSVTSAKGRTPERSLRDTVVEQWRQSLTPVSFSSLTPQALSVELGKLVDQMVVALQLQPADATAFWEVGKHLVGLQLSSPEALEHTLRLLPDLLYPFVETPVGATQAWRQVSNLCASLAAGFCLQLQQAIVDQQEELHAAHLATYEQNLYVQRQAMALLEARLEHALASLVQAESELSSQTARVGELLTEANEAQLASQRSVQEATVARRELDFLIQTSSALAKSLDYETTLNTVARLAVPTIADWCCVDMYRDVGPGYRVATAHIDPLREEAARQLAAKYPLDFREESPPSQALRSGRYCLVENCGEDFLRTRVRDQQHRHIIDELEMRSLLCVPLVARGRALGVLSFIYGTSGRSFDEHDIALAIEVTNLASIAIDNARLFEKAQEAIRLRDNFLAIAAHELKTPLATLMTYTTLAKNAVNSKLTGRLTAQEHLSRVERQSKKLAFLINQLLDVTRIKAGKLGIKRELCDLRTVLNEAMSTFVDADEAHRFIVQAEGPTAACIDAVRVEQVLVNLLDNAIRFSPPTSPIEVSINHENAQRIAIAVRDHGHGVPPEHRERIFERFYQVSDRDSRQGFGLGLYISRQIAHLHQGSLFAEFPEDGGSKFVLQLPVRSQDTV